jgi:hypothetical protein
MGITRSEPRSAPPHAGPSSDNTHSQGHLPTPKDMLVFVQEPAKNLTIYLTFFSFFENYLHYIKNWLLEKTKIDNLNYDPWQPLG